MDEPTKTNVVEKKYCQYCGQENPKDALYCVRCGKPLSEVAYKQSEDSNSKETDFTFEDVGEKADEFERNSGTAIKKNAENVKDERAIKYSKLAYLVSSIVTIISTFLPDVTSNRYGASFNIYYIKIAEGFLDSKAHGLDGIFLIILSILAIVFFKLRKNLAMLIVGAISALFAILEIMFVIEYYYLDDLQMMDTHIGIGFYLQRLAPFVMCASSAVYYYKMRGKKK